jgi:hypothetical protein
MHNGGKAADFPSAGEAMWSWTMLADEGIVMGQRKTCRACADAGVGKTSKAAGSLAVPAKLQNSVVLLCRSIVEANHVL